MTDVKTRSDVEHQSGSSKSTSLKITKAKLVNNMTLTFEAEEYENGNTNEIIKKCGSPVHDDLRDAIARLRIHMACLCELVADDKIDDSDPLLEKITVTSVSIGGDGDHEGATITGTKKLRGGKALNLNAPFTKFMGDEKPDDYLYLHEFHEDVEGFLEEVRLYLGGKYGDGAQLEMSFDGLDEDEI